MPLLGMLDINGGCLRKYEPDYDKTYNKTCTTSENLDQSTHPRMLISFQDIKDTLLSDAY